MSMTWGSVIFHISKHLENCHDSFFEDSVVVSKIKQYYIPLILLLKMVIQFNYIQNTFMYLYCGFLYMAGQMSMDKLS